MFYSTQIGLAAAAHCSSRPKPTPLLGCKARELLTVTALSRQCSCQHALEAQQHINDSICQHIVTLWWWTCGGTVASGNRTVDEHFMLTIIVVQQFTDHHCGNIYDVTMQCTRLSHYRLTHKGGDTKFDRQSACN